MKIHIVENKRQKNIEIYIEGDDDDDDEDD